MSCHAEQDKRQPGAFVEALSIGISPSCHKLWPEKSENATITGNTATNSFTNSFRRHAVSIVSSSQKFAEVLDDLDV